LSEKTKQQLTVLNMRVQNVNLAFNDLLRDMTELFKTHTARIAELEKENAELKAKQEKTSKH
jgi:glycine cleavage system regulatory protein